MSAVPGDEEMPLVEHVKELRFRMMTAAIPIILITILVFFFSGELLQALWKHTVTVPMTVYAPMELFLSRLTLSLVIALFIGIPLIVYETFMFVSKGLYENEKSYFIKIVPSSLILFVLGAAFAYFLAVPLVFKYTIFYSIDVASPAISVANTVNTIITLVVSFGLVFQLPLLMVFAMKMGIVNRQSLKGKRKFIYGAFIAFAFFISPDPSALSEILLAGVLVLLFELSLLIYRFF